MTRPVWDWAESPGSRLSEAPRVSSTPFGDGYSQRQADGLNAIAQDWTLQFKRVSREAGNEMIAFLRAQGGVTAFEWTPVWASAPILVTCAEWDRTELEDPEFSDITARFVQRFEP